MLVPITNVGSPPTRFALKMRPVFMLLLFLQAMLMVARFIIMDMWGAMLTFLVVLMGTFVLTGHGGVDTTYCMYYGLMCLVNGIFDIILCVERWVHVKYHFFSKEAPFMFNVASVVFLLCPIVEIVATVVAAMIYMDAQEHETQLLLSAYGADIQAFTRNRQDQNFVPFHGRCHHL
eukprot:TRINITY_DN9738_c0_g1_i1.p1 TRINITY_DN9738_c0_g1~~TRINITY_DN9738_c0_g1_i1.p1  ORF type:complete len:176 (-),score=39.38 TRINITY_DN9738_c0_g1_i1:251-778(-)